MSRQRPFGSLLKRILSHSRNKDSADIFAPVIASRPRLFSVFVGRRSGISQLRRNREMSILSARVLRLLRQASKRGNPLRAVGFPESRSRCQFATCGVERGSNIEIPDRKRIHLLILGNSWGKHTRCNLLLKESPLIGLKRFTIFTRGRMDDQHRSKDNLEIEDY